MAQEAQHLPAIRPVDPPAPSAIEVWTDQRREFVRKNFCGGAPEHIADLAMRLWERRGLSPEERHVYLVKRGNDYVNQTGIDGFRLIAHRTGVYAGSDAPVFERSGRTLENKREYPDSATVTVWKLVQGQRMPFSGFALWEEFNVGQSLWLTKPFTMLAKCAEAQALRKAFANDLSNLYVKEEMDQADAITVTAREVPNRPDAGRRYSVVVGNEGAANAASAPKKGKSAKVVLPDGTSVERDTITDAALKAMQRVHAIGNDCGLDHTALHLLGLACGFHSLTVMSETELLGLGDWIETAPPEEIEGELDKGRQIETGEQIIAEFTEKISQAPSEQAMLAIGEEIKSAGIDDDRLRAVYQRRLTSFRLAG